MKNLLFLPCLLALVLAPVGCGPQESEPEIPWAPELDPGWNELAPGGETGCSRGTLE